MTVAVAASTLGMEISEMSEYRYQDYVAPVVYAVGDKYFAVFVKKPKHKVGTEWVEHPDQFWALKKGTKVWFCNAVEEPKPSSTERGNWPFPKSHL